MSVKRPTKADLLKVIEILLLQLKEEQRMRSECIEEMISMNLRLPENEIQKRIKEILKSPDGI